MKMNMKKIALILTAAISLYACKSADKKAGDATADTSKTNILTKQEFEKAKAADTANATTIQWLDSTTLNLGKLKKDQEVEVTYKFKNIGDKNLVIASVTAGCGCTIPETPKEPFAPGQEGLIKAKYNGSGSGIISKHVTVVANTKPSTTHELTFTGEVVESK
jgi:Protein of unknown function (DUF1573)